MSAGATLGDSVDFTLSQRDGQQQSSRFLGRISVDELIKSWDVVDLNQKVPAVDEHRQAGAVD